MDMIIILIVVGSIISEHVSSGAWHQSDENIYFIQNSPARNWNDAKSDCVDLNTNLAAITSQRENDYLDSKVSSGRYWIGLRGPTSCSGSSCRSRWYWDDRTPMIYMNWKDEKPPGGRGCGLMENDGTWDASSCGNNNRRQFICKGKWISNGSYEYIILNRESSWTEANAVCTRFNGGHLASITDETENAFVKTQLGEASMQEAWIGLRKVCPCGDPTDTACTGCSKEWQWSTGETMSYTDLRSDEPGPGEACGKLRNDGWYGDRCEVEYGFICKRHKCANVPCVNGTCNVTNDEATCHCNDGIEGIQCDREIDECEPNPCENGGSCEDLFNGYICSCEDGFTGIDCETDIDECMSEPCSYDGNCTDLINSYSCSCFEGLTGYNCETNIDDCVTNSCINGSCVDGINTYTCDCLQGFTGSFCETEIDECASMPCINGDCIDQVGSYQCRCNNAFSGTNCEIDKGANTGSESALDKINKTDLVITLIVFSILAFALGLIALVMFIKYIRDGKRENKHDDTPKIAEGRMNDVSGL